VQSAVKLAASVDAHTAAGVSFKLGHLISDTLWEWGSWGEKAALELCIAELERIAARQPPAAR